MGGFPSYVVALWQGPVVPRTQCLDENGAQCVCAGDNAMYVFTILRGGGRWVPSGCDHSWWLEMDIDGGSTVIANL